MRAEIISIGDELLIGQVVNTNASYLSRKLGEVGIGVERVTTVGDSMREILRSFKRAWSEYDLVIVTGGLGPTHDDISKAAVARFFRKKLKLDRKTLKAVEARFARFGYVKMPASNVGQAMVPEGSRVLANGAGTAPGLLYKEKKKVFVILPGVPREMEWICEDSLLKLLKRHAGATAREVIRHRILMTTGIGESALAELIGDVNSILEEGTTLAFLPKIPIVRLRISARGKSATAVQAKIARIEKRIRVSAGNFIYGVNDERLEGVVVQLLTAKKLTIATAESCTGGLLSARLTDIPGASEVFPGGVVSYADDVKKALLEVPDETLQAFGAVSEETAREMAEGIRTKLHSDFGIAITGIAGPSGGSAEKPVGTVWIALAKTGSATVAKRFQFGGERDTIRERAAYAALDMLRRRLLGL